VSIESDIKNVMTSLADNVDKELFGKPKEDLEKYWFFKYDKNMSLESNMYKFHDLLNLYVVYCRRWEEHHNGHCCVVERVRDNYIMPKIQKFIEAMHENDK
jgi:hypothetical protein